jgi:O-antigen/teichoic acid export membrane protein
VNDNAVNDAPSPNQSSDTQVARRGHLASFGWLGAGMLVSRALQFVVTIYLTRVLLVDAFGLFSFVQAFLWFGVILTDFGLSTIGTRDLAQSPRRLRTLSTVILALRLAIFAVEMLLILVVPAGPHVGPNLYWLFVFSFLSLLAYAITTDWIFRGFERMEYVAAWEALPRVIWLAGLVLFVHGPQDLLMVPLLRFVGEIVTAGALLAIAWARYPQSRPVRAVLHPLNIKILVQQAAPVVVAALLGQVYYNVDTILLGILKDAGTVGHYSAAYRVVTLLLTGAFLLAATYQPILARTFATDRAGFAQHLRRLSAAALLLGVVLPAVVALAASPIVRILFGGRFAPAAGPLVVLMGSMPFAYLGMAYGTALVAAGMQRHMMIATAAGAAVNVAANLLLIPPFGMMGAAIATVVSYAAAWAIQWRYVRRLQG